MDLRLKCLDERSVLEHFSMSGNTSGVDKFHIIKTTFKCVVPFTCMFGFSSHLDVYRTFLEAAWCVAPSQ